MNGHSPGSPVAIITFCEPICSEKDKVVRSKSDWEKKSNNKYEYKRILSNQQKKGKKKPTED